MHINITGRHLEITSAMRQYVEEKIAKLTRHFDQIIDVNVILYLESDMQVAEATIFVSGADIVAKSFNRNMYAAIDGLQDKLDRQVIRYKERIKSHKVDKNCFIETDFLSDGESSAAE